MSNYIVDGADLTSVANAIRTKGGTSAQLAFPQGFVDAVDAIETGGGGYTVEDYLNKNFAGAVVYTPSSLDGFSLRYQKYITSISFPNVSWNVANTLLAYACANMQSLTSFSAPKITRIPSNFLRANTSLTSVDLSRLTDTGEDLFYGCTALTAVSLPSLQVIYKETFRNCTSLESVDLLLSTGITNQNNFNGCSKFETIVIRKSNGVSSLSNINNFTGTPFASGGSGGTLYVPSAQIANYQAATNWSTILGYANNQIKSIESTATDPDAPVDLTTHYIDGTPIPAA